jgi:hypothetical protein
MLHLGQRGHPTAQRLYAEVGELQSSIAQAVGAFQLSQFNALSRCNGGQNLAFRFTVYRDTAEYGLILDGPIVQLTG